MKETAPDPASASAPATPMMAQYIEIKGANPDCLLFYRMGDFYELFFEDAEIAARALGIALTKRGKHAGEDIAMCGVPVHAADDYLQKLIGLGHRVAVCEQLENPAEAKRRGHKAVVRRDVVRLVTPGTVTEEALLDPAAPAAFATLARLGGVEDAGDWALAVLDLSSGAFSIHPTCAEALSSDLARLRPREVVLTDTLAARDEVALALAASGMAVQHEPRESFDAARGEERLKAFYAVAALEGLGLTRRADIAAAGAALAYVERTQLAARPTLSRPVVEDAARTMAIDAATRASLELARTQGGERRGSLLHAVDRTVTAPGARLLAERLLAPSTDVATIEARLDAVACLVADDRLCGTLRARLSAMPDMARALSRLALSRGGPRDLAALRTGLSTARQVVADLSGRDLPAALGEDAATLAAAPRDLLAGLEERLAEDLPLHARDGGMLREGADEELDNQRRLARDSRQVVAGLQATYAEATGVRSLKVRHNAVLGHFIEVTAANAAALQAQPDTFIHRQTMANAMRFTTAELADLQTRIANAAQAALTIELAAFEELVAAAVAQAEAIRAVAHAMARIDVAAALATLAGAEGYCRPRMEEGSALAVTAGRHPVVEQALRAERKNPFVPNDLTLDGADGTGPRQWLLTGPNMGGKSTFLRQNALIVLMAQAGSFVPAGSATVGVVDRLFSRVGAADDLARGRSTFMVEMVETAAILNAAGPRSLVILDEIGRGTATFDGLSIAWGTLEHLAQVNGCRTLFATHYHELTALKARLTRLANVTMAVREWKGDVVFLHEVVPGEADRSYGIQVAKLAGLPEAVVARARDVLAQLEETSRGADAGALVDDLPLFAAAPMARDEKADPLTHRLGELDPDAMSPRDALEALYELKRLLRD